MTTITQNLLGKTKRVKRTIYKRQALKNCPQKQGKVVRVFTRSPKKPCSGKRRVAYIRLISTKQHILCRVPYVGERHLKPFSHDDDVLVTGGRSLTIPECKYKVTFTKRYNWRGFALKDIKKHSRSKFAVKLPDEIRAKGFRYIRGGKVPGLKPRGFR